MGAGLGAVARAARHHQWRTGGACRGLRWGLLSELLDTTSGVLEMPAGGWPLAEVLSLFILWASVSTSLQDEDK